MHMKMTSLNLLDRPFERRLMNPHRIRKTRLKKIIIPNHRLTYRIRQLPPLLSIKISETASMLARDNHGFKGPRCPPGNEDYERGITVDYPLLFLDFENGVVDEKVAFFEGVVGEEVLLFGCWFVGGE